MRQKDLDLLHDIIETEREFADACELPGLEVVVGTLIKKIAYGNRGPLDFRRLEDLLERIKDEQRTIRSCPVCGRPG